MGETPTQPILTRARRRRLTATRAGRLALGVATSLMILMMLECTARVGKTLKDDFAARPLKWYRLSSILGWESQPGFAGMVFGAERRFDAAGLVASDGAKLKEAPARSRVVILGDSRSFGFGVPTAQTYSEELERRVPGVATVNLGFVGYTSYQGRVALERRAEALKPAAVVIAFGFNDRRFVAGDSQPDGADYFKQVARRDAGRRLLGHVYLARLLARVMGRGGALGEGDANANDESRQIHTVTLPLTGIPIASLRARVSPEDFRRNLTAMAETARAQGAVPVFLALADRPADTAPLREAEALIEAGQAGAAAAKLEPLIQGDLLYRVYARRLLAEAYRTLERAADAERMAKIDHPIYSLHGSEPIFMDEDYNRITREVAAAVKAPLVAAGPEMARHPEVYNDFCHFNAQGHAIVAQALAPVVAEAIKTKTTEKGASRK